MGDKNEFVKGPPSIISEIEDQLDEILSKKKESVEKELKEKIRKEEEEAKKRLYEIEQEMVAEKEALLSYRNILSEFEDEKIKIKKQIQKHLDKAAKVQSEIENKTVQTLEELNKVADLNEKLEGINQETEQKVVYLKENLEQKYGISPAIPEYHGENIGVQIRSELDKLNKIKELLETNGNFEAEIADVEPSMDTEEVREDDHKEEPETEAQAQEVEEVTETTVEPVGEEEIKAEEVKEEEVRTEVEEVKTEEEPVEEYIGEEVKIEEEITEVDEEVKEEDMMEEEALTKEEEVKAEGEEAEAMEEEDKVDAEADDASENEEGEFEAEIIRLDADEVEIREEPSSPIEEESTDNGTELNLMNTLDKYRKSEGTKNEDEISYFENEDRMTLDGDYIIATIHNNVNEAKKLYIQLSQTKSPKEQFFIKQEIIRHQEAIRKLMLNIIRICEKDTFLLPYYTQDILNVDVFKIILEKVSMENWSNQEDFNSFNDYDSRLKDAFYERITPPTEYLNSIMKELKITA